MQAAGAQILALATNTMHQVYGQIAAAVSIPFPHIADPAAAAVRAAGLTRVGLLGTRFTMESRFYTGRLESAHGLSVLVPDEPDRDQVHRVIYDELVQGVIRGESRKRYLEIISRLADRGAEAIIAGCTEIELLVTGEDASLPYFPTTRLHAEAIAELALADGSGTQSQLRVLGQLEDPARRHRLSAVRAAPRPGAGRTPQRPAHRSRGIGPRAGRRVAGLE